jgi:DNA-binding LytR/AlgR family response regulator
MRTIATEIQQALRHITQQKNTSPEGVLEGFMRDKLVVIEKGRKLFIPTLEILYCVAKGSSTEIVCAGGVKRYVKSWNLGQVEKHIATNDAASFLRVHNSYLVNMAYVTGVENKRNPRRVVLIVGQEEIPVGENYQPLFRGV